MAAHQGSGRYGILENRLAAMVGRHMQVVECYGTYSYLRDDALGASEQISGSNKNNSKEFRDVIFSCAFKYLDLDAFKRVVR